MDNAERKYIDAEEAIRIIEQAAEQYPYKVPGNRDTYSQYNEAWQDACDYILSRIEAQKPADVKLVKRGQWIKDELSGLLYCSNCHADAPVDTTGPTQYKSNYCPLCGVYMR